MSNGQTLFDELSDPNHPLRQREWDTFLERRQQLFDDLVTKIGLDTATRGVPFDQDPLKSVDAAAIFDALLRQKLANELAAEKPERMRQRDFQQVIGQAILYGIPNPEEIPFGELQQLIEEKRLQNREGELDDETAAFIDKIALGFGGPAFVGTIDAMTRTAETLPFLGKWVSDREAVQGFNQMIGALRESHMGSLDEGETTGAVIQEALGGIAGYLIPGVLAWRAAGFALGAARIGGVTRVLPRTIRVTLPPPIGHSVPINVAGGTAVWGLRASNPILHLGIQGGMAATMLEAGGDGPITEKALNIFIGTGLGTAFGAGGKVAVGTVGGVAGGIVGMAAGEGPGGAAVGAATGIALGLAGHRAFRAYQRYSGGNQAKNSTWHEPMWQRGMMDETRLLPQGNLQRPPAFRMPQRGLPPGTPRDIGALPEPTAPRALPGAPEPRGLLPEVSQTMEDIGRFTFRGNRTLFFAGDEAPEALIQRWATLDQGSVSPNDGYTNRIQLDNTGKLMQGAKHVYEVEARFNNLFVLTPESLPVFQGIARGETSLQGVQNALRDVGFDGLAVQGIDDLVMQVGPEVVGQQMGLSTELLSDQVIAFGTPYQVRLARPIIDGDVLDQAFFEFGSTAGRQVAGIQATTFSREAAKNLRPFEVGSSLDVVPTTPIWLSEARGVRFVKTKGIDSPLVPEGIDSAILQHHETFGPRIMLLDHDRIARATIPVASLEEGTDALARMGFSHMDPNSQAEAVLLAHQMSNADLFVNNSLGHILGQIENPTPTDLVVIAFADNPGRISVVSDIGSPHELRQNLKNIADRYDQVLDFDKNTLIVERPTGVMHAIVGPEELLTPQIEKQFKQFGVFSGMQAGTADGAMVRVNSVWQDKGRQRASISPLYSDIKATVPLEYVLPGRITTQVPLTGNVYNKFKQFALSSFNKEIKKSGLEPATELADPRVMSLVDTYISDYGKKFGLETAYELDRFASSLEWNLARDMQRLAGPDGALYKAQLQESANEITRTTLRDRFVLPDLESLAEAKGFIWEPPWSGKHGQLVDQQSNTVIPFTDRLSARAFLQNFHREPAGLDSRNLKEMNAFPTLDSHTLKSQNTGVEFVTDADEARSMVGTIKKFAKEADDFAAQAEEAERVLRIVDEIELAEAASPVALVPGEPIITPPPTGDIPPTSLVPGGPPQQPPPPPNLPVATGGVDPWDPLWEAFRRGGSKRIPGPEALRIRELVDQIERNVTAHPDRVRELGELMHRPLLRMTAPVRTAAQIFDDALRTMDVDRPTLFNNLDDILQSKTIATNHAQPMVKEAWDILKVFRRGDRRLGPLYEIMTASTAPDGNLYARTGFTSQREQLMDHYNFTPPMREAVDELRNFYTRMHVEAAGFTDIGFIMDYLPRLRHFLDLHGEQGFQAWNEILPDNLKWFATYARDGQLQSYHKDVGRVTEAYIRGLYFEKHVRVPYEKAQALWTDPRMPEPLQNYVGSLLYVVRHGHPKGHDGLIRGTVAGLNHMSDLSNKVLGTPRIHVNEGEVLNAFGTLSTAQYRGLLGNSPRTNIREFYQPMLLAAEIGIGRVLRGYGKFLGDPNARREWFNRANQYGWSEPNRNAVANAEFFTGELRDAIGKSAFAPDVTVAREGLARRWDKIYDRLPNVIKNGIEGNPFLDPLWSYRKYATNTGRTIAGNTGYENAAEAIARFRRGEISFDRMLAEANAAGKSWSVRQDFIDKINAGDFEGAAVRMGTDAAGTQFHFGIAEQSETIRNAGMLGRKFVQFGNFTLQHSWRSAREVKNRPWRDSEKHILDPTAFVSGGSKLSYAARMALLSMLPGYVGGKVGWEEMKRFNWFRSLTFGGGTFVDPMLNLAHSNTAIRKVIAGEPLSPEERFALGRMNQTMLNVPLNPYGSTLRTARGYLDALADPNPVEAFFRMTLTGFSGAASTDRFLEGFSESLREETERTGEPIPLPEGEQVLRGFRRRTQDLGISQEEWDQFLEKINAWGESPGGGSQQ